MSSLLELQKVTKVFSSRRSRVTAVEQVEVSLPADRPLTLAIVGESGSGKSTLANLVLGFTRPTSGRILYCGKDAALLKGRDRDSYRREVQAVFQNPFDAFNPFYMVDHVFDQVFRHFQFDLTKQERQALVEENLQQVRLDPGQVLGKYSYQMSGGQLQRILVARALLLKPRLLIADEPVSMIDASLRITVLDIMARLKQEHHISQMYITHDLSTALQISDEIMVMYKGRVVEKGPAEQVILQPAHPYTQMLIKSIPIASPEEKWEEMLPVNEDKQAAYVEGQCGFCGRCQHATDRCREAPPRYMAGENHEVCCWLYEKQ